VESVENSARPSFTWTSHGRIEGHLAVSHSPAGAFSADSSTLALVSDDKVLLMGLRGAAVLRPLRPHIEGLQNLQIQSANFLSPTRILLFATGLISARGEGKGWVTPLLAFQWNIQDDSLYGKVNSVGMKGDVGRAIYFPRISHLGISKPGAFEFWNPNSGRGMTLSLPNLTRRPNVYEPSPDGHWLLVAQVEGNSSADPIVIRLQDGQFVDTLAGHQGTVLSLTFAPNGKTVVTACEDGNVRLYSAPGWKLLATLRGHRGPVHWAEFSPDGQRVASAGEDRTVRIWSAEDGRLEQTLAESQAPMLTVAFSPNGEYLAASCEQTVFVWERVRSNY
jgi:WD40 repeat protein